MTRRKDEPPERRRGGVEGFRKVARDVTHISRMQLDDKLLARLGQKADDRTGPGTAPDFVFYTGCNVLKTPHIALLALDIMDTLGIIYHVMGGPTHCCGIVQMRTARGDLTVSPRAPGQVLRQQVGPGDLVVPELPRAVHRDHVADHRKNARGASVRDDPIHAVPAPAARSASPISAQSRRYAARLASPPRNQRRGRGRGGYPARRARGRTGRLGQPAVGLMSNYFRALPAYRRELQKNELAAAEAAEVDALVAVYHADHRELCAHERDYPFRIMNVLEIVGESMGLRHEDQFKRLKMMQDVDAIMADCGDLVARHGLDAEITRQAIQAMTEEQPLSLRGADSNRP